MAHYKDKVTEDLDRWIAGGLVDADKRGAILATLPEARRLDAATSLAWVGALLLGIAVITFVSANWDITPKLLRFAILLATFMSFAGLGAYASQRARPLLSNIALMLAALVFAASIGLTGQIFDIAGDPKMASYGAGVAAFALALAGRSTAAATVGLVFIAFGDFADRQWFSDSGDEAPWMLLFAPVGILLALRWGSAALAHVSAAATIYCFGWFAARTHAHAETFLLLSILMGAFAAGARWLYMRERPFSGIFYGWFTWGALVLFASSGFLPWFGDANGANAGLLHRLAWLTLSGATLALGRHDRHAIVTAIGVVSMIGAIFALLNDLGLNLLAAAGVFLLCSIAALVAGLLLRSAKP